MKRNNLENDSIITYEFLDEELKKTSEDKPYFVVEGFVRTWNEKKNEISPTLEEILNFMFAKGYDLVTITPHTNMSYRTFVFKRR